MSSGVPAYRLTGRIFCAVAVLAVLVWSLVPGYVVGWDLRVYGAAATALRAGHDPYLDGMAVQRIFHATGPHPPGTATPFTYVYSPITLLLIKLASLLPLTAAATLYWTVYAAATVATLWVASRFAVAGERPIMEAVLIPGAIFFPGLLQNDVLFAGNVAYLVYAGVLLTALLGWRRERWLPFYATVLVASCFKAPFLTLLAIPVFSGRRQWRPAILAGAAGLLLFAAQPLVVPGLFHHYLQAVELQFSYNHDFSSSPAGLFADALYDYIPYQISSGVLYAIYACLFCFVLHRLAERYRAGHLPAERYIPVLMIGVLLLNPRIMEYDLAPITLFMALVFWRFVSRGNTLVRACYLGLTLFGAINAAAARTWRPTACLVLVGVFAAGCWDLFTLDQPPAPELLGQDDAGLAAPADRAMYIR